MHVTWIDSHAALVALAEEWKALDGDVPFRRLPWLVAWWRHFGLPDGSTTDGGSWEVRSPDGILPASLQPERKPLRPSRQLLTLAVRDADGTLLGVAPWYLSRSLAHGRAIRFLASGVVCSDYLTILSRAGREADVAGALADWLVAESDRWDLIDLDGVDAEDTIVRELGNRLAAAGHRVHLSPGPNCWRAELPSTWEEYLAGMAASKRQRARRLHRRLIESGRASIRSIDDVSQWDSGFRTFCRLHQLRRESLGERGCFARPEFGRFLDVAGRQMLATGHVGMLILEIDGRPAAVEFNLLSAETVYYYQGGVDPALLSEQPGHLLTALRIERAIASGHRAVDFLRGDEPYKAHWEAKPRPLIGVRIVRRRPAAQLRHGVWLAQREARRLVRRGLDAAGKVSRKIRAERKPKSQPAKESGTTKP
ncbi:MAG: GNAT family N-acetyltransferase [Planctomycetia bacterium]|nr:GNAT family N-acetyltransferase [Planctomycetia bacterium]